jgi:hypothetical protein
MPILLALAHRVVNEISHRTDAIVPCDGQTNDYLWLTVDATDRWLATTDLGIVIVTATGG